MRRIGQLQASYMRHNLLAGRRVDVLVGRVGEVLRQTGRLNAAAAEGADEHEPAAMQDQPVGQCWGHGEEVEIGKDGRL